MNLTRGTIQRRTKSIGMGGDLFFARNKERDMAKTERRISRRVPTQFKINYIHEGDYLISKSKNISVDGMFIYTQKPPPIGEETNITFSTNKDDKFTVKAKVVWVNKSGEEKDHGVGVQFIKAPAKLKEAILARVKRIAILEKI